MSAIHSVVSWYPGIFPASVHKLDIRSSLVGGERSRRRVGYSLAHGLSIARSKLVCEACLADEDRGAQVGEGGQLTTSAKICSEAAVRVYCQLVSPSSGGESEKFAAPN